MDDFIDRCLTLMGEQNISQMELSKMIDKPYKSVNNWFNNRNITPKTEDAVKIARALKTSVEYLITGAIPEFDPETQRAFQVLKKEPQLKKLVVNYSMLKQNEKDMLWEIITPALKVVMSCSMNGQKREESAG